MQTDKQANEYKQIKSIHAHTHTRSLHTCMHTSSEMAELINWTNTWTDQTSKTHETMNR